MAPGGLTARLRALLGEAASVELAADGMPRAAPRSTDACALLLRTAAAEGWRVRVEGSGQWMPPDAPADLVVTTRSLRRVTDIRPADFVATAEAGIAWGELRRHLADHGTWVAHDHPGGDRTLGSVVATGTAGPLRAGFGTMRDHILGLTLVTGDGRVVRAGGRVVKNVAGYDIAKLAVGSFGAFGVLTAVHLRLRAVPRADLTLTTSGPRDRLVDTAQRLIRHTPALAAVEVFSPSAGDAAEWTLAVRALGTNAEVAAARDLVLRHSPAFAPLRAEETAAFWRARLTGAGNGPVTVRLATLRDGLADALDLVAHYLDEPVDDWLAVTVPAGVIRWSGAATADRLMLLRRAAAEREIPMTIERAPWTVRSRLGHFGAYREGVARLVAGLRHVFDPAGVLEAPVGDDA